MGVMQEPVQNSNVERKISDIERINTDYSGLTKDLVLFLVLF